MKRNRPPAMFFIPTLEAGGAERVCLLLANSFKHFRPNLALQYCRGELLPELSSKIPLIDLSPLLIPTGKGFHPLQRLRTAVYSLRATIRSWLWNLRYGLWQLCHKAAHRVRLELKTKAKAIRYAIKNFLSSMRGFIMNDIYHSNTADRMRHKIPAPLRQAVSFVVEPLGRSCFLMLHLIVRMIHRLGSATSSALIHGVQWIGLRLLRGIYWLCRLHWRLIVGSAEWTAQCLKICVKWLTMKMPPMVLRVLLHTFKVIGGVLYKLLSLSISTCLTEKQHQRLASKSRHWLWERPRLAMQALDGTMAKHVEWRHLPTRCAFLLKQARQLARSTRRRQCELIFSFLPYTNAIAVLAKLIFNRNLKVVINVHSVKSRLLKTISSFDEVLIRFLVKRLYAKADLIVAVAHGVRQDLIENFGLPAEQIIVINNPIDLDHIRKMAQENVSLPSPELAKGPLVVAVGRLTRVKGFDMLINAIAALPEQLNAHLLIIGDGEEKEALQKLARTRGLNGRVKFMGFQKNPWKYMRLADCLVLSSRTEALPNVIGEALALDLPVLATDCSLGVREYLQDGRYGVLVPPNDENMLAQKLEQTLKNIKLRETLSHRASERAAHFALHRITDQFETTLSQVMLNEPPYAASRN